MRGAVQQLRDVDGHVVVLGGELALSQPLQSGKCCLDPALGPYGLLDDFFTLVIAEIEGGEHLEIGPHRGERGPELV
ncbi:Uncharacterised protein [Mycobacteroides abscessus subsp. abscessus]|nr:Uncharacterised protein [Mycobacteroides abscessus subsp. abscessus]SLD19380.1 Uncharacterised protein [Mycobacteroides abscessus subsp. massiliense]